jgi:beta-lactamase superfamily II metal-dependent hydrolase
MPQRVILDGLWCGQGMANMVRIYKDLATDPKTKPSDYLCVFDFGSGGLSASKKVLGITPPVAFMMEQLELQVKAGRTATIDLMLISHQDRDHWQLLGELNEQIVKRGMTVVVGEMILSGANWRASSKTAVKKFIDRAKGYYWYDGEFSSYYDPAQPLKPLNVGDMSMTMLVTNVATNDTKEDIDRNCSSAVVLLQLGQLAFILPGDATWETFARLRQIMKPWPRNPLPFVYAASVPHHGALRTMNRNTSVVKPDLQDLIWFTDYARPTSIYASAGIKNTHSHPYRIVLETMGRYTSAEQFQQRPIVVFNGATSQFELLPDIRNNIYTTVLNLTTPAQTANWIFNITPTTHDTSIQLFNAGVPGILSAPELSEMELAAQRANAMNEEDFSMIVDDDVADFPFPRSKVLSGPTMAFTGEMPVASNAAILPPAVRAQPLPVLHLPQPPAGSAPDVYRRPPPPRRVQARAAGG